MPTLVTSKGMTVVVGRELGRGGEGSVYEVPALPNQVAKLYHRPPDAKKQAKLSFMAATADDKLLSYIAWPQETLHTSRNGPVTGFLMPKVAGRDPVHAVYSPAHRRHERPNAAWDFLLYVARNTAAAFEVLHAHGHVLGDVNQGNVLVGNDSKVVLIDSDSFQIDARGEINFCEVGVSHFTPPELQGLRSFRGITRTRNHDAFGLALLIFHLLFGGRHPYSGVPLRDGVGESLEEDIKAFRYAYARDARARGFEAPPRSIPVALVAPSMHAMFELAFTEQGATGCRPTAQQWVAALDAARSQLKRCPASPMHVFMNHLGDCPWCALEKQGAFFFVDLGAAVAPTSTGFVLARVWALIEAVPAPSPLQLPDVSSIAVTPAPLPASVPGKATLTMYKVLAVLPAVVLFVLVPQAWLLALIVGIAGWALAGSAGAGPRAEERAKRKKALDAAQRDYEDCLAALRREAGPEGFLAKRAGLAKLKAEYEELPKAEQQELMKLHSTAQERQKKKFLDSFYIDGADIPGIGPARKATLRSYGIETAADVKREHIRSIRGFGENLTRALVDWRASCERQFRFNPATAVSDSDRHAVRSKFAARRVAVESQLSAGAAQLQQFRQMAVSRAASLQPQVERAAKRLAQARADLTLVD